MWSWQCLLMASQFEGGASRDWMERIGENTELSCPNFNVAVNNSNTLTLKRRLMTAPYLFNSKDFRVQTSGLNLIRDIQKTLAYAIEQLKISNIQDTYCLALPKDISENCEVTRPQNVDGCYLRAGIDKSKTLDTMNDEIEGSILSRALQIIFGEDAERINYDVSDFQYFVENGVVSNSAQLSDIVLSSDIFFPTIRFPRVQEYMHDAVMKEVNVESFTTRPTVLATLQGVTYATQSTDCSNYFNLHNKSQYDFYHLKDVEHSLLGSPRELLMQLFPTFANMNSFDTEQAVFLAFKIFLIEIYNSRFFSSENYHVTWQFNAKTTRSAFDIYVKNLYEFQQFMKEKQFDCGEANWDTESVTNTITDACRNVSTT